MTLKTRIKKYNTCINLRFQRHSRQKNNFRTLSFRNKKSTYFNKSTNLNFARAAYLKEAPSLYPYKRRSIQVYYQNVKMTF